MTAEPARECVATDLVVAPEGRLDALTAPILDRQLRDLPAGASRTVAIDLSRVTYVSSSGLRVLLLAHRRQRQGGGRLLVRYPAPNIWQVIRMCGFDQILEVCREPGAPSAW